ncbi:hypothetical protein CI109_102338 [Kwoniella shandongensis]|uniref:Uncharacterized protein n=1 Tax=Kwoniella shandongensis TaxID=1734106 RepID=A0A5M6C091_9TREE|nr:uncharacterized protein CI109_003343 [Kwoniella shandongensis]KAA5528443.1 hypothetical protein CI109_003343 [Kwoniella shandongensis]
MSRYDGIDEREYGRGRRRYDDDDDDEAYARSSTASTAPQQSQYLRYDDRAPSQISTSTASDRYLPGQRVYDQQDLSLQRGPPARDYPGSRDSYRSRDAPERSEASASRHLPSRYDESATSSFRSPSYTAGPSVTRQAPPPSLASNARDSNIGKTSDITETLEKLSLTSFYVRPGYGEMGKHLTVLANFFQVRAKDGKAKVIYHYDVDMEPQVDKGANAKKPKGLLRAVWEQLCLEQKVGWVDGFAASAYDGRKNVFTPNQFPIGPDQSQTFLTAVAPDGVVSRPGHTTSSDDEYRRWKVTLKLVAVVDLQYVMDFCQTEKGAPSNEEKCLTGLMATNVLLRDVPSKRYAQVGAAGNKFFSMAGAVAIPQGGVVCKGFMQSFRYSSSGLPLLNLDVGYSAFLSAGPALEVIGKILNRGGGGRGRGRGGLEGPPGVHDVSELSSDEVSKIKKILRGAKFTVMHRSSARLHTILSVTSESAQNIKFNIEGRDGNPDQKISIPEYYQKFHQSPVTKPRLPCVQYGKKAFIPIEFVRLAEWNSLPPTKLTAEQTAEMIKVSAVKPKERAMAVNNWRTELAYEKQSKIAAWGLQVNTSMVQVKARILPPPRIVYARGTEARALDGGWNLKGKQFFRNGKKPLVAWSVISFDRYTEADEMQRYITYLCQVLSAHGVQVANRQPECIGPINPTKKGAITNALQLGARAAYMAGKCPPQLICCVLPGRDAWLYEAIKRSSFTDLKGPVPTQCMQAAKIRSPRGIDAYTGNLVMKIQSKLGGVTHQIPISELPGMERGKTMLLGGDLGLPPVRSGDDSAPTVACTIATYSPDCDAYSAQIRLQEGRGEIIVNLSSMVEEHLKIFMKNNDSYPERILIFRDGISEGQYAAALHYEHNAVLKACSKLEKGYRPRILLCICAKRHSTRFFGRDTDADRSGNLPSGLVVDRSVTHPYAFDFFLQAHAGRVGTARPTHYICLLDELAISPDQLQQLVHSLCYSFARCTRSVSLVPVCYIADLVCQKARIIVHEPGTSVAPSESSAGKSGFASSRKMGFNIDIMQVQKVLQRNEELSEVAWWM